MKARTLLNEFKKYEVGPYIEVPCSILAPIISELLKDNSCEVINPVNEAVAMGLAAGSYMATQRISVVMTQNSGLSNTLNALTSLNQIYQIPVLYLVSWRGEPGTKDAPEHDVMGEKTKELLDIFGVSYVVLSEDDYEAQIEHLVSTMEETLKPVAIILKRGLIDKEEKVPLKSSYKLDKERAVDIITDAAHDKAYFIATNGFISREVFHNLSNKGLEENTSPFYMLGSMGHALPIALGMSKYNRSDKYMIALDGDGGCLMHLGSMASVGKDKPKKLMHIVLDNSMYASTGGQPTVSGDVDICKVAKGCGYHNVHRFDSEDALKKEFPNLLKEDGPTFVHILINDTEYKDRIRISEKHSCEQIKERFMKQAGNDRRK